MASETGKPNLECSDQHPRQRHSQNDDKGADICQGVGSPSSGLIVWSHRGGGGGGGCSSAQLLLGTLGSFRLLQVFDQDGQRQLVGTLGRVTVVVVQDPGILGSDGRQLLAELDDAVTRQPVTGSEENKVNDTLVAYVVT